MKLTSHTCQSQDLDPNVAWRLLGINNDIDDDDNDLTPSHLKNSLNAHPVPGAPPGPGDTATGKTDSALRRRPFQWGRKAINYYIYETRMLWGEIKQEKGDREGRHWRTRFRREIREGLSNNVTSYTLLRDSCEYLGEHSRKREQPGRKL